MTDHDVTSKARQLLEESMATRLRAVEEASAKERLREQLVQQLATAEAEMEVAWKSALDAGWEERELKRLGLTKPGTKTRRPRPPKPRANGANSTQAPNDVDLGSTASHGDESE